MGDGTRNPRSATMEIAWLRRLRKGVQRRQVYAVSAKLDCVHAVRTRNPRAADRVGTARTVKLS